LTFYRRGDKIETKKESKIKLSNEHIKTIEKILNQHGIGEVIIKVEDRTKIVILQSNKKRVV